MTGNDVTWLEVTGSVPEVALFDLKSLEVAEKKPISQVLAKFGLLHCCNLQEVAVRGLEITSHDWKRPEVTRKRRHLTGSHLEVAVECLYVKFWVRLSSCRAVTHR